MKKFIVVLAAFAVALLSFCPESQAAITLKAQSLVFNGAADDLIGAGTTQKDGKADASFTLVMTGAQAIREISLKNDTTGTVWSTSSTQNPLIVINAKGDVLSGNGRMTITPVIMAAEFRLVINDAAAAIPKDSTFTATATLVDGAQTSASATVKAVPAATTATTTAASADSQTNAATSTAATTASNTAAATTTTTAATSAKDEVSLFETRGTTDQDFAGEKKSVSSNGKN
ncbi:MAG: hypothetical protein HUJ86_07815, partial [Synergistes sp.]|nr:hypothetical protein [Synergistes sp.]